MRAVWRVFFLAIVQIGAWALILFQAGLVETPEAALEEALSSFTFMGSSLVGTNLDGTWNALPTFIALNGMLFIPVSLFACVSPKISIHHHQAPQSAPDKETTAEVFETPPSLPRALQHSSVSVPTSKHTASDQPPAHEAPPNSAHTSAPSIAPAQASTPAAASTSPQSAPARTPQETVPKQTVHSPKTNEPFRGSLPPLQIPTEIEVPAGMPESAIERVGPPPPPIRFHS